MATKHDTIATRLAIILTKLNNGERFTIEELADEFNVNIRTIQRDLNERLSYIPIIKEQGIYRMDSYALGKLNFEDIKNFATLSGIKSLYPTLNDKFIVDILNSKINKAYLIKNQGFEESFSKYAEFELLSAAILNHHIVSFVYNDKHRVVNPYKLINNNGVWYLLADEDETLKNYTVSKISKLQIKESSFTPKKEFLEKIEQNDTNWFSNTSIEVVLEIDNNAKEYFTRKEILPNKKIIEENKDCLIISTKISYDDEILNIVKHWIPYIKIISPIYLQEKLNNILIGYIKTTQPVGKLCDTTKNKS
jgi:predicted DNA-binding transcriptional regulator YafY